MRNWDDRSLERFNRARSLGEPALLRLRAENLLHYADEGEFPLTDKEREQLERISAAPTLADEQFLGSFDHHLEAIVDRDRENGVA